MIMMTAKQKLKCADILHGTLDGLSADRCEGLIKNLFDNPLAVHALVELFWAFDWKESELGKEDHLFRQAAIIVAEQYVRRKMAPEKSKSKKKKASKA